MQIRQVFDPLRLCKLVKKILTRFAVAKKPARSEGTQYRSPRIYLPTKLTDDSSFPFKEGDLLTIRVDRPAKRQRPRTGDRRKRGDLQDDRGAQTEQAATGSDNSSSIKHSNGRGDSFVEKPRDPSTTSPNGPAAGTNTGATTTRTKKIRATLYNVVRSPNYLSHPKFWNIMIPPKNWTAILA